MSAIQTVSDRRQLRPDLWTVVVPTAGGTKYVQYASQQEAQNDVFQHHYGNVEAPLSSKAQSGVPGRAVLTTMDPRQLRPDLWTVTVSTSSGVKYIQFATQQDAQNDVAAHGNGKISGPTQKPGTTASTSSSQSARTPDPVITATTSVDSRRWNAEVRAVAQDLSDAARDLGLAAFMEVVPLNADFEVQDFDHGTNKPKAGKVLRPPADGTVQAAIVMNASGHAGELEKFARTNTYSFRVVLPDGKVISRSGVPHAPVSGAPYATVMDVSFPLQRGTTVIEAWPDGSGGPEGYKEGRRLFLAY